MNYRAILKGMPSFLRHRVIDTVAAIRQRQPLGRYHDPASYWSAPWGLGNDPRSYAAEAKTWDVDLIERLVLEFLPNGGTVLEFGCNVGRILHRLARLPNHRVIGVEINKDAVAAGKTIYPELQRVRYLVGDGSETLKTLRDGEVDLSYSSHALRHVPPDSIDRVIRELARVTGRYIITSEDEGSPNVVAEGHGSSTFPRNYRRLLTPLGWRQQVKHYVVDIADDPEISLTSVVRIFERDPGSTARSGGGRQSTA